MLFNNFFKDKIILITGHTGFIGSWLTLWLESLGSKVIGFSLNHPTTPSLFQTLNLEDKIQHYFGDINNIEQLKAILSKHKPEIVFHLAAQSLVRLSYQTPLTTLQTNIMGTANLLESIKNTSVKSCIVMTSDKCYRNYESFHPYDENDALGGSDPYSASKAAAEIIVNSYQKSFFDHSNVQKTKIATVRSGNVIGGGDWALDRLIPDCVRNFSERKHINLRNPNSVRPFQYVLEPISGMLCLAEKMWDDDSFNESWNLGPSLSDNPSRVDEVVNKVIKYWNGGSWKDTSQENSLPESKLLLLNSQKAIDRLDWSPVFDIDHSIKETVIWYKKYHEQKNDMEEFSKRCISYYSKKAIDLGLKWTSI
jgi:CDP-glucose 4,6-dehydratase|tara:strand:+ start:4867 stop:5964 length:1098 start_codon:yes stop_codon:yes gene_type:complete